MSHRIIISSRVLLWFHTVTVQSSIFFPCCLHSWGINPRKSGIPLIVFERTPTPIILFSFYIPSVIWTFHLFLGACWSLVEGGGVFNGGCLLSLALTLTTVICALLMVSNSLTLVVGFVMSSRRRHPAQSLSFCWAFEITPPRQRYVEYLIRPNSDVYALTLANLTAYHSPCSQVLHYCLVKVQVLWKRISTQQPLINKRDVPMNISIMAGGEFFQTAGLSMMHTDVQRLDPLNANYWLRFTKNGLRLLPRHLKTTQICAVTLHRVKWWYLYNRPLVSHTGPSLMNLCMSVVFLDISGVKRSQHSSQAPV